MNPTRQTGWLVGLFFLLLGCAAAPVGAEPTAVLESTGKHKVCGPSPGLAGWLVGGQEVWSLERTLEPAAGKPAPRGVVVSFFGTFCEPCKKGLPLLQEIAKRPENKDIAFILVAVPPFPETVPDFLSPLGVTLPTIKDKFGSIWKQWSFRPGADEANSVPRTVVINDVQQIVQIFGTEGSDFRERLQKQLQSIARRCKTKKQ